MDILVLFRDWINAERRSYACPLLPIQFENNIDEMLQDFSDDDIDALEKIVDQPILDVKWFKTTNYLGTLNYYYDNSRSKSNRTLPRRWLCRLGPLLNLLLKLYYLIFINKIIGYSS